MRRRKGWRTDSRMTCMQLHDDDAKERDDLSDAQRRIWSQWLVDPYTPICNVHCAVRLVGRLNVRVLHRAIDTVLARHHVLRAAFCYEPGHGPRHVPALRPCRVVHTDMRALPKSQREQCVEAQVKHHATQPFDLATGPLIRIDLLKLEDDERVLLVCMHRLISDEAFLQAFVEEVICCYGLQSEQFAAACCTSSHTLRKLPPQSFAICSSE